MAPAGLGGAPREGPASLGGMAGEAPARLGGAVRGGPTVLGGAARGGLAQAGTRGLGAASGIQITLNACTLMDCHMLFRVIQLNGLMQTRRSYVRCLPNKLRKGIDRTLI